MQWLWLQTVTASLKILYWVVLTVISKFVSLKDSLSVPILLDSVAVVATSTWFPHFGSAIVAAALPLAYPASAA